MRAPRRGALQQGGKWVSQKKNFFIFFSILSYPPREGIFPIEGTAGIFWVHTKGWTKKFWAKKKLFFLRH